MGKAALDSARSLATRLPPSSWSPYVPVLWEASLTMKASTDAPSPDAPASGGIPPTQSGARPRLDSIDLLRGCVMVLMALDHVRDFLGQSGHNPRDLSQSALFLTRWVTHFCAPTFFFLAGISAFLYGTRGRTRAEVSRYLVTRGLWLVVLEITVVRFGWTFDLVPDFVPLQVIWALGCSMMALAVMVRWPRAVMVGVALVLVMGHNLLDGVSPSHLGAWGWLWKVIHVMGPLEGVPGTTIFVIYPLVPWIGVMAAGYAFGPVMLMPRERRRRWGIGLGAAAMGLFVLLRWTGIYGDPVAWAPRESAAETVLAALDCEKYPPSLLFLCMTLAPGLVALGCLEGKAGGPGRFLVIFGRVPMLYYVAHIYAAHLLAILYAVVTDAGVAWLMGGGSIMDKPEGFGLRLPGVYLAWLLVVVALYPVCQWFAALKQRRRDWWLSYL